MAISPAQMEMPSGSKEVMLLVDVWKSVTTMSGGQCVMTFGEMSMLQLHADSWDSMLLVLAI